jgi:protein-S-isoprenylcysteine O-methyltransferase Ste14
MAGRILSFVYGAVAYAIFLATFLYAIGFVGNRLVPKSIDSGEQQALAIAIPINIALLSLFALQHSLMARPVFKEWFTTIVPQPVERSTFVLLTCAALTLLFWQWRPVPQELWRIDNPIGYFAMQALFTIGWLTVLASTFMLDHFELFGLKGAYQYLVVGEPDALEFKQPMLYAYVRHPIMLGFLIAFWATPVMTAGHLLFAVVTTAYVLIAIQFEERDLVALFGNEYREYRMRVPMIFPRPMSRQDEHDSDAVN